MVQKITNETKTQLIYAMLRGKPFAEVMLELNIPKGQRKRLAGWYGAYKKKEKKIQNEVLYPMLEKVKDIDTLWAHKDGLTRQNEVKYREFKALAKYSQHLTYPYETLYEHSKLTLDYFQFLIDERNLKPIFENFKDIFELDTLQLRKIFDELLLNAVFMHDMGKININFQIDKMENPYYIGHNYPTGKDSTHALTSSIIYIDYCTEKYRKYNLSMKDWRKVSSLIMYNAYIISHHHGNIMSFNQFQERITDWFETLKDEPNRLYLLTEPLTIQEKGNDNFYNIFAMLFNTNIVRKQVLDRNKLNSSIHLIRNNKDISIQHLNLAYTLYLKLFHSLIIASDYYATSEYMTGVQTKDIGTIYDIKKWTRAYETSKLAKIVQKEEDRVNTWKPLNTLTTLNEVRTRACAQVCLNYESLHDDIKMTYLQAPTGIGKSHIAVRLAMKALQLHKDINKVFYVFPFNNLASQTDESLSEYFGMDRNLLNRKQIINYVTPMQFLMEEDVAEVTAVQHYTKSALSYDFMHSEWTLTSNVQFFNAIFSPFKASNCKLYQFANSVVILDEIQAYANKLWPEISHTLEEVSKLLNIRFIVMSATLPYLPTFTQNVVNSVNLLPEKDDFYNHPTIKNRVVYKFDYLTQKSISFAEAYPIIVDIQNERKRLLVECITKSNAMALYSYICSKKPVNENEEPIPVYLITGDDNRYEQQKIINMVKDTKNTEFILVCTQVIEAGVDIDCDAGIKDYALLDADVQFSGRINRNNRSNYTDYPVYFINLSLPSVVYKSDYRCNNEFMLISPKIQAYLQSNNFDDYYDTILNYMSTNMKKQLDNLALSVRDLNLYDMFEHMQLIHDFQPITLFMNNTLEIEGKQIKGCDVWTDYMALLRASHEGSLNLHEAEFKLKTLQQLVSYFCYSVEDKKYPMAQMSYNNRYLLYIDNAEPYFTDGKFDREKLKQDAIPWTEEEIAALKHYGKL